MYRWCSNCNKKYGNIKQFRCSTCNRETDLELDIGDTLRIDNKREFIITRQLSHFSDAGMSAVYMAARKDKPEMQGAIKVAKFNKKAALKREAEILQKLQHNHIIRLVHPERALWQDRKEDTILHFFALEYMDGGTLKDRLKGYDKLSLDEAVRIVLAIGAALSYAHEHNIAHLDVKPANILFSANGRVVLSDFGIARDTHKIRQITTRLGTRYYNSPEQLTQNPEHTLRADIYALGVILYEMLVGVNLFGQYRSTSPNRSSSSSKDKSGAALTQPLQDDLPPPRQLNRAIPQAVEQVILKAIAPNPAQRYHSVKLMTAELRQAMSQPTAQKKNFVPLLVGGMGLLLAIILITIGLLFYTFQPNPEPTSLSSLPSATTVVADETPNPDVTMVMSTSQSGATAVPLNGTAVDILNPSSTSNPNPLPTSTRRASPTPPPTPIPRKTATPQLFDEGTIELIAPAEQTHVAGGGDMEFQWKWNPDHGCQTPPEGYGFEVRVWLDQENANKDGAMDAKEEKQNIRCDAATGIYSFTIKDMKGLVESRGWKVGKFRWDVALVRLEPYQPIITAPQYRILFF